MYTETKEDENSSDDEEVAYETDVYLSKALSENLHVLHYPMKTKSSDSQDHLDCLSARMKPKQQKIELEFGIDIDAHHYDRSRGEQFAYNVDGQSSSKERYFDGVLMDKILIQGTKVERPDEYAVGFMREGKLHVTPVNSVIEMCPGFVHMDKIVSASKKALNLDENEGENDEAVAVTVRFEGPNAERDRQIREKSYNFFQQKNSCEPWTNLTYHKLESVESKSERERLLCSEVESDITSVIFSKEDYLKGLVPEYLRLSGCQTANDISETAVLQDKPLSDQIKQLMLKAQLLTFSLLIEKLPHNFDSSLSVERLLQQVCVLVQGCWAVKSDLLYGENVSPYTGINAQQLKNARDYILWLFRKSRFVKCSEILPVTRITFEDFEAIITPLAIKTKKGWEFKFPTDTEFLKNHPSIEENQSIKWNINYNKLIKDFKVSETEAGESSKATCSVPSRPRQKRHSHSSISEGDESGTDSGTFGGKVKSKRAYISKKRPVTSPTKHGGKSKPFPMATLDISPTFLENPLPENVKSEFRDFVGDAVCQQFCMTYSELKELVLESHLSSVTNRGDFESLLDEALNSYGAQKLKNKWPQNTVPKNLYAFTKFGNRLDRYREALLDLFSTTARTRSNLFVKKVEDELRERVSEADCRQIFEEYCVYKSGFFYLKGTITIDS
ncbi:DNA-directed RNA polymerase III subunit RPC5 [Caerostris darwini]|uniref:DNA-directed RNA polymerase III subunit RPC5 n=1 Tax=Caerostris darwini TaxID=1538125 RepID=A0AAV4QLX3_9ARAC|nr:DNA-directed RNA polymerase III subunit RPC5 [Caerostris darwini]